MTEFLNIGCPMCGKYTPLTHATFKAGDPQQYFIVKKTLALGARGFRTVDETYFVENLDDTDLIVLANELFDMSSGLVISALENNLPLHRPAILLRLDKLIKENEELKDRTLPLLDARQTEKVPFDLQEARRDLLIVIPRLREAEKQNANLILTNVHMQGEIDKLMQDVAEDDRDDVILGLGGEIVELKKIVEGLQSDIKDYENRLLDL